jgi:cytochrome c-type biogenesis protein CcmH/NrfG
MSGGVLVTAGRARLYRAASVLALSASLFASLIALAPQLQSGKPLAPGAAAAPAAARAADSTAAGISAQRLRKHLERQPRDARAWVILARLQAETDHFAQAAEAYEQALALPSKVANDAAVWCEFADALGMTQGGRLAGRPRDLIARALALDPNHPKALEMAGSAAYGAGEYAAALRFWRPLLAALQAGSQASAELAAAIARAERLAAAALPAKRE